MVKTIPDPSLSRRDLLRLSLLTGAGLRWMGGRAEAGTPPVPSPASGPAGASGRYLEAAVQAARWIRSARVQTLRGCVWLQGPERPQGLSSTHDLYHGGAGVVLFLLQLGKATGEAAYLEEASLGADALMAGLPDAIDPALGEEGLYTGVSGIGFTLEQVHQATGKMAYRQGATRCRDLLHAAARPVGSGVEWGEATDIIQGIAGAGLYLLDRARQADDPASLELAVKAGRRLIGLGIPEAGGLKWRMGASHERLMPNFSHGTAGVAYFLATLHRATGQKAFLDVALAGARYLQAVADTSGDGCLIFHHEPGGKDLHYLGWCHGPVGTVRLFHQLAQATGDASWNEWVRKGARSILASGIPERQTPGFWNNVGQCCGSAGVAELFLQLHPLNRDAESLAFARRVAADLLRRATPTPGDGLKWVHAEHRVKPEETYAQTGYMQGAAGIGMLFLHLDAVERGVEGGKEWGFRLPDSPF